MRQDYSRTAEAMALLRAAEQARPSSSRIIEDPYAAAFLQNPYFRLIARFRPLSRLLLWFLDHWAAGGREFLLIRARLVDDLAAELAAAGLEQIVLLGAGFDTLALRIREALRGVRIFEVDHPATQAVKREVMARLDAPSKVRFAAVDFEQGDFAACLRAAGFAPERRSLIVWVGVSYYLTAQALARALTQIAALGGAGTRLVFDYMLAEVIDGTSANRDALSKARRVARLGEPWLFGLTPAQVSDYLAPFGFKLLKDYEPAELRARYCPQSRLPMSYVRIAICERA
jgi:methyltransferase (TIGR00027 family)